MEIPEPVKYGLFTVHGFNQKRQKNPKPKSEHFKKLFSTLE